MSSDPFVQLGLGPDATVEQVRDARRRMAREHHPDRGGDAHRMQSVNAAADAALIAIRTRTAQRVDEPETGEETPDSAVDTEQPEPSRVARDAPSFTVEALPVETFEALLIGAATLGDLLDDDPPYRLDAYLRSPYDCWCRLDVVPDAGASTVSITIAAIDDEPVPPIDEVRDAWVSTLNALDWP